MLTGPTLAASAQEDTLLFVVTRARPELYDHLRAGCQGIETIEVVLDRRHAERRRWTAIGASERRRTERRSWHITDDLGTFGFAVVQVDHGLRAGAGRAAAAVTPADDVVAFLRDVNLFRELDDRALGVLASKMDQVTVPAGTTLVREGEWGSRLFIIRSGTLVVSKAVNESVEKILVHMKHGEFFGEMSVFTHRRRSATVRALTDAVVLVLDGDAIPAVFELDPQSALRLVTAMVREFSNRLSNTDELVAEVTRWGLEASGLDDDTSSSPA